MQSDFEKNNVICETHGHEKRYSIIIMFLQSEAENKRKSKVGDLVTKLLEVKTTTLFLIFVERAKSFFPVPFLSILCFMWLVTPVLSSDIFHPPFCDVKI